MIGRTTLQDREEKRRPGTPAVANLVLYMTVSSSRLGFDEGAIIDELQDDATRVAAVPAEMRLRWVHARSTHGHPAVVDDAAGRAVRREGELTAHVAHGKRPEAQVIGQFRVGEPVLVEEAERAEVLRGVVLAHGGWMCRGTI